MEPQLAKAAGTAQRCQTQHPPTLHMVREALRAHDEKKGASVVAIKRFILAKYPTVDPIRLKYQLKQALSKGLSCGDLVRPLNSSAVGATGTFKLAHKKPKQKLSQADPDLEQAPKAGQKGTTKAPAAGARQRGATKQQPTATKQPKKKPVDAQPRAAKPKSQRAKHPPSADQPQAHASGPPKAASHRQAPQKGHSTAQAVENTGSSDSDSSGSAGLKGPRKAPGAKSKGKVPPKAASHRQAPQKGHSTAQAVENTGSSDSDSSGSAGLKGPRKAPGAKSKGKVPKGAQRGAPKAQGGQDQAKKPRVTPGAGQGKARVTKAAPMAADRKAP